MLGSTTVTNLFTYEVGEWLRAIGSGSRFESITRGVLDLRDIFYYLTIVVLFLLFTRKKLESLRWSNNFSKKAHNYWIRLTASIVTIFLLLNFGFSYVTKVRIDLTQGNIYSLSNSTKQYLKELDDSLLIRGYFSSSTHPLLAPLVPRVQDLLHEYAVQGAGNIQVEFVDPLQQAKFEEEAGVKYGIRPVSFHSESKYQASVINTYFNILIAYKDQFSVLNYKDLVELKASAGKHEVDLNNPEYQITRSIRSVTAKADRQVNSFEGITDSLVLTGYLSSQSMLSQDQLETTQVLEELSGRFQQESNDNFDLLFINPDDDQLTQEYLRNELGVRPVSNTDGSGESHWFYFTLTDGKKTVPVSFTLPADKFSITQNIFAAYKRLLPDSVKTVALMRPLAAPGPAGVSESPGIPKNFSILRNALKQSVRVIDLDLKNGVVPNEVEFLMVLAPRYLHPDQIHAIQEFLVQGGTVLIASSPIDVNVSYYTEVYPVRSGLEPWLSDLGISIEDSLVLDKQHGQYSLSVLRQAGEMRLRETKQVNYPYIIDVRGEGLNQENGITAKLGQVFVPWASPISISKQHIKDRKITPLLYSSNESWTSDSHDILPDFEAYPEIGFATQNNETESRVLATMIEGKFGAESDEINSSRLIVVGSSALFTDNYVDQMSQVLRSEYRRPIQFMQNLVDWSLEDQDLLEVLRKHSQFTRTLTTLDEQEKNKLGVYELWLRCNRNIFGWVGKNDSK